MLTLKRVDCFEELSACWIRLTLLVEQMVRAILKQLLIRAFFKLGLHLKVLSGDVLHIGRLLDLIFAHDLLNVHLETLARAKCIAILCKYHNESWIYDSICLITT